MPKEKRTSRNEDRPIIGIVSYGRNEEDEFPLPAAYVEAVRLAGGLPIILPPGEQGITVVLERVDGLILSGGGDIDPNLYDGSKHPANYMVDAERDRYELPLARLAVEKGHPTLAICRGTQVLNVALGGDLIEHIPDVYGDELAHRLPSRKPVDHEVRVAPDTHLAQILGQTEPIVRSWHHQALKRLGKGLQPTAWAADGVIEAVESGSSGWLIGVLWHPELTLSTEPSQRLFSALIAAARQRRLS